MSPFGAMSEDDLLVGLMEAMLISGWRCTHVRRSDRALTMGSPGWPDIAATPPHGGPLLVIEAKSDTGSVSDDQARWLVALAQGGTTTALIRPSGYDRAVALILAGVSERDSWAWAWRASA